MVDLAIPRTPRRVLFVDDDPSFSQSLKQDLNTRAFEVENVTTPDEAIFRVAMARPDLVVLDLYLPNGAALDLLRRWKEQAPGMVVILVSGGASLTVLVDALKEGARRFFTKSVSAAALLEELDERQRAEKPGFLPLAGANHQLGAETLKLEGVDRFFAISPGLLAVAGFDGYFKMLNPAWEATLGHSVDELCALPYLDLVHPDDREKANDEALEIRGGQAVFCFTNRYRCKDQSYRWLAWSATPSPAHRLIYASARDVTNSVRIQQGLRQSNERFKRGLACGQLQLAESAIKHDSLVELGRFKDEVTAMILHDLKVPLSVIVSNYDFLMKGFEGSADHLEALHDSRNAGERILRLLANLLDVARLESGTMKVSVSENTLSQLMEPVAEQRRVLARSRRIAIVLHPHPESVVTVDVDLVTRAMENIFDNALRHTPIGGRNEIEVREVGLTVELRIGNSGSAIPVSLRTKIFEKYWQEGVEIGPTNTGLGLYFCRLAVEAQGGGIWVEETELLPTVFGIRLPRGSARAAQRAVPALVALS